MHGGGAGKDGRCWRLAAMRAARSCRDGRSGGRSRNRVHEQLHHSAMTVMLGLLLCDAADGGLGGRR
jgi:hypothetical protein